MTNRDRPGRGWHAAEIEERERLASERPPPIGTEYDFGSANGNGTPHSVAHAPGHYADPDAITENDLRASDPTAEIDRLQRALTVHTDKSDNAVLGLQFQIAQLKTEQALAGFERALHAANRQFIDTTDDIANRMAAVERHQATQTADMSSLRKMVGWSAVAIAVGVLIVAGVVLYQAIHAVGA